MKVTALWFGIFLALGNSSYADMPKPVIALDFERCDAAGVLESSGTWEVSFRGKDPMGVDAKNGSHGLHGSVVTALGESSELSGEFEKLSIATWVKVDPQKFETTSLFMRLAKGKGDEGFEFKGLLRQSGGNALRFEFVAGDENHPPQKNFESATVPWPAGPQWMHIAVVFSGGELTFYVDGEELSSITTPFTTISALPGKGVFYVGGGAALDDWCLFDAALTRYDIMALFKRGTF